VSLRYRGGPATASYQRFGVDVRPETLSQLRNDLAARLVLTRLYFRMDRVIVIYASHESAAAADREALRRMSPQARLDRLLRLQHAYREQLGDTGRGFARIARVIDRASR